MTVSPKIDERNIGLLKFNLSHSCKFSVHLVLTNVNILFNKLIDKHYFVIGIIKWKGANLTSTPSTTPVITTYIRLGFFLLSGWLARQYYVGFFFKNSSNFFPAYILALFLVCFVKIYYLCSSPTFRNLNSNRLCTLSK